MASEDVASWRSYLEGLEIEAMAPRAEAPLTDPVAATRDALAAAGLGEVAANAASAGKPLTFVINDAHRFTHTLSFLEATFAILDEALARDAQPRCRLLVAAGTHVAAEQERRAHEARVVGPWLERFDACRWHEATNADQQMALGDFVFNSWAADGGFYLACGSMEPHYFAGVTGAHKTLTVGVMSRETVERNHAGAMSAGSGAFRLDGNPVHEGVVAALGALRSSGATLLALNQVVVHGRVAAVTAGDPLEALEAGLPVVERCMGRTLEEPLDLIVARVDQPLNRDLYQADKGIKNTEAGIRDGGVMLVEAECSHGVGIDHFVKLLERAPTHREALAVVDERGYRLGDHKAVKLRALTDSRSVRVGLVSPAIDVSMEKVLGMRVFTDRASAARWAREEAGSAARAAFVDDAGNLALQVATA